MDVRIITVPYDSGHRAVRMGRGPLHLIDCGFEDAVREAGHEPHLVTLDSEVEPPTEVAVAFELAGSIAAEVRSARGSGAFPVVLAGNCISAIGIVSALGPGGTGVLWFDAHADLNTPETTGSGFLDGMAVAALTGRCWTGMTAAVKGFKPLTDSRLAFVGVRDLDQPEDTLLASSTFGRLTVAQARAASDAAIGLEGFAGAVALYAHIDLDVLDPSVARANQFAADDGLSVENVVATVRRASADVPPAAAALTALDPAFDDQGRASAAAISILLGTLEIAAGSAA